MFTSSCRDSPQLTSVSPRPTEESHLPISSAIHAHSPRSQFKKPSSSKWKAVLAYLSPLRLSPARLSCRINPSLSSPATELSCELPPSDALSTSCAGSSVHHSHLLLGATPSTQTTARTAICDSFPFSFGIARDVEKLLQICQETPLRNEISKRTHALAALCALCVSSPNNANRCIAAGGVGVIIYILDSTAQPKEESEKALLLLQLLTSASEDGCSAALQYSSSIVNTLGKKLLRISESCTASAIAVLIALCRRSDAALFRKTVSKSGIPSKLVVVLQVASKDSTKRRAGRLMRLLEEEQTCD